MATTPEFDRPAKRALIGAGVGAGIGAGVGAGFTALKPRLMGSTVVKPKGMGLTVEDAVSSAIGAQPQPRDIDPRHAQPQDLHENLSRTFLGQVVSTAKNIDARKAAMAILKKMGRR
jgi:hypothetical protein